MHTGFSATIRTVSCVVARAAGVFAAAARAIVAGFAATALDIVVGDLACRARCFCLFGGSQTYLPGIAAGRIAVARAASISTR
jgi:hypothetical protein